MYLCFIKWYAVKTRVKVGAIPVVAGALGSLIATYGSLSTLNNANSIGFLKYYIRHFL
jgi:hypothetical protein